MCVCICKYVQPKKPIKLLNDLLVYSFAEPLYLNAKYAHTQKTTGTSCNERAASEHNFMGEHKMLIAPRKNH